MTLATFIRLEARNFWYSTDYDSEHENRLRLRIESKIAINHEKLSDDNTIFLFIDAEYYLTFGEDISERFASKFSFRIGSGYCLTYANRFELLFIYDFDRDALDDSVDRDAIAFDLRFKFYF